MAELLVLPGCSRKKAEAIVDCRPFKTWDNLVRWTIGVTSRFSLLYLVSRKQYLHDIF